MNGAVLPYKSTIDFSRSCFLYAKLFCLWLLMLCCSNLINGRNEKFPCTLFSPLWEWTVTRHVKCLSHLGPFVIYIHLFSIWISKIRIKAFPKWHPFYKINQVLQLYILLIRWCTAGNWMSPLYFIDHVILLEIVRTKKFLIVTCNSLLQAYIFWHFSSIDIEVIRTVFSFIFYNEILSISRTLQYFSLKKVNLKT